MSLRLATLVGVPLLGTVVLLACGIDGHVAKGQGDTPNAREPAAPATARAAGVTPPFDVAAIRARYKYGFHQRGDAFLATRTSHVVQASASGLSFTPRDTARPSAAPLASPALHAPHQGAPPPGASIVGAALTVAPARIERGGVDATATGGGSSVDTDGSLLVDRGPVRERVANGERGVEQSWTFAHTPAGAGDLVLRLATSGEDFRAASATGLHFVDPASGRGVAYGTATWVDAGGKATPVVPTFESGDIVLRVPEGVLTKSAYPATLDPNISPERGVDQPIFGTPVQNNYNASPAIDYDGANYFVTFFDDRVLFGGVYGVHVRPDGTPVENAPIVITEGYPIALPEPVLSSTRQVGVAFDGTNHLVVYVDQRGGKNAISAKRVSSAGTVIDASPIEISPPAGAGANGPAVAYDGSEYVVVWSDPRNAPASTSDIFATRVSTGGSVLNASSIKISGKPGTNANPTVVYGGNGDDYVAWTHDDGTFGSVLGALVASNGTVVTTDITVAAGNASHYNYLPSVASSGSGYLLTYLDTCLDCDAPGDPGSVAVLPIGANGVPTTSSPVEIASPLENVDDTSMYSGPSVAFDGSQFIVAWSSPANVAAQIFTLAGAATGFVIVPSEQVGDDESVAPGGAVVAASSTSAMIAAHTTLFFVQPESRPPVGAPLLGPGGASIEATTGLVSVTVPLAADGGGEQAVNTLSVAANEEDAPAVGFDGHNYLVAWGDTQAAGQGEELFGVIVDQTGAEAADAGDSFVDGGIDAGYALGGSFPIVESGPVSNPAIAFDGTDYLVVYTSSDDGIAINAKRVTPQGQALTDGFSPGTFVASVANGSGIPSVVFDGKKFLVTWNDAAVMGLHLDTLTTGTITPVESSPAVIAATDSAAPPAIASGGNDTLVVWSEAAQATVRGAFVTDPLFSPEAGVPDGGASGGGFVIASSQAGVFGVAAAYDSAAAAFRVAWADAQIGVATVKTPATVSAVATLPGSIPAAGPAMAFDGTNTVVVWTDVGGSATRLPGDYGVRINAAGTLVDAPGGFAIAASLSDPALTPSIASNGSGSSIVTYSSFDPSQGEWRAKSRIVSEVTGEALGAGCTGGGDCASGFCADGVCCNAGCGATEATRCSVCSAALGASADGQCTTLPAGFVCRASAGDCRPATLCDGTNQACPADMTSPNGTVCSDGVCESGVCVSSFDAGPVDAGIDAPDAAPVDAATDASDAAPEDAGAEASVDGAPDGPPPVDAGIDAAPDAAGDATVADASAPVDSGPPIEVFDAAAPTGTPDASFATFPPASGGCSCRIEGPSSTPALPGSLGGALLALAVLLRRRRA